MQPQLRGHGKFGGIETANEREREKKKQQQEDMKRIFAMKSCF